MFNTFDVRENTTGKNNNSKKRNLANKENIDIDNNTQFINHMHRHSEISHPDAKNIFDDNR